jgi:hypothetical protein
MEPEAIGWSIAIASYLYVTICLFLIARETGTDYAWFAFVPILNVFLLVLIAYKPMWWILGCFIPLLNIVVIVLLWMGLAEVRDKPAWMGLPILIPGVNLIFMGYLAFSA